MTSVRTEKTPAPQRVLTREVFRLAAQAAMGIERARLPTVRAVPLLGLAAEPGQGDFI